MGPLDYKSLAQMLMPLIQNAGDVIPFKKPGNIRGPGSYDRAVENQVFAKQLMDMGMSPEGIKMLLQGAGRPSGVGPWGGK